MNLTLDTVNLWGARALDFAWPVLWQSSLLIGLLWALEVLLRRRVRAAVRYALWLVVPLKLLLPPALALPTGPSWWLRPAPHGPAAPPPVAVTVTYGPAVVPDSPEPVASVTVIPARAVLTPGAWALAVSGGVSLALLAWMLLRWRQVARDVRQAGPAPQPLHGLLEEARRCVGLRRGVRLGLTERPMSPAVCGLFRPCILLPRSLAEQLSPSQLRAVLVHELIHLRRGDVWVNCAQTLLQLAYWWHPLLWLANARIRRLREEAVDDGVMLSLQNEAEAYAPALLEVARLALERPLTSLGLVGILESHRSLRRRIQRLLDFRPPRQAGLTLGSAVMVLAFAAVAVPMGQAPAPKETQNPAVAVAGLTNNLVSTPVTNVVTVEQKLSAAGLVRDAMFLYQTGELDRASIKLKQALVVDPRNEAAYHYLNLIAEARFAARLYLLDGQDKRIHGDQRAIYHKLETIRLDDTALQAATLGEAVVILNAETREHDPDKVGINFLLVPGTNSAGSPETDLGSVHLGAKSMHTQLRLVEVLGALVKVADRPLKYTVEDYGVVISPRLGTGPEMLFTRSYKLDPNRFIAGMQATTGVANNATGRTRIEALRNSFAAKGVELNPPKSLFYNETQGRLYVRATRDDLDTIDQVLPTLFPVVPPQINIKCKFVEVVQNDTPLGFDWFLGNMVINNGATGWPGTIAPLATSLGLRPGMVTVSSIPFSLEGVLTDPQYRVVVHALDQRDGTKLLAQQSITTLSGRQAQFKVVQVQSVLKGVKPQALTSPGTPKANGNPVFEVEPMEMGPVLDIAPTLLADGYTLKLSLAAASLVEFLGNGTNGTNQVTVRVDGQRKQVRPPQPVVGEAKVSSEVNVWDGQTVVLGGLVSENITMKDGQPVLGGMLRSESRMTQKRQLMVFITPTLVDPAGNRVHSEDEMPFSQNAIPPQLKR